MVQGIIEFLTGKKYESTGMLITHFVVLILLLFGMWQLFIIVDTTARSFLPVPPSAQSGGINDAFEADGL